jgi:DNA-binding MarR family transcriptional regulator
MSSISPSLKVFLNLAIIQTVTARKFDNRLSNHGISLNDFMILYHLGEAPDEKLRRIDLAEKIGLTASGVTRMLVPLEKTGLVRREVNSRDARVSYVKLAPGGKRILAEGIATAEQVTEQISASLKTKKLDELSRMLLELGGTIL